jgi:hypothetical protein
MSADESRKEKDRKPGKEEAGKKKIRQRKGW